MEKSRSPSASRFLLDSEPLKAVPLAIAAETAAAAAAAAAAALDGTELWAFCR
jgi:hypothetical protein